MKPEIKQKWIEALRSGKYKQGDQCLLRRDPAGMNEPRFCCLGVLCDLYVKEHPEEKGWVGHTQDEIFGYAATLPPKVQAWADITEEGILTEIFPSRYPEEDEDLHTLVCLNDNGYSFEEIADIIEKDLLKEPGDGLEELIMMMECDYDD